MDLVLDLLRGSWAAPPARFPLYPNGAERSEMRGMFPCYYTRCPTERSTADLRADALSHHAVMPGLRGSAPRPAEYQTNGDGTKNGGEGVRANAFGRRLEFVVYLLSRIFGGCCHLIDSLGNRGRRLGAFNR